MSDKRIRLKEGYKAARCCSPKPNDPVTGYHSHNNVIVVHRTSCEDLEKIESHRLIWVSWKDILDSQEDSPGGDYYQLDRLDFRVLQHHQVMGLDYSLMVARILNIKPEEAFEHHRKLRALELLKRVQKVMIQYRKNVVDNKWIKHRNHTYYQITPKGEKYLEFYVSEEGERP